MTDNAQAPEKGTEEFVLKPVSPAYRRYALTLFVCLYALNYLDREVVHILAEPIKRDLGLTDSQIGLMTGLAFVLFFSFLGIPVARLAERKSRPLILASAVGVWSIFTVLCGFANNFMHMFLLRIGVGAGEAGLSPSAHSLIVDYVPREKRASSLAIYSMGASVGAVLGLSFGGVIADSYGWRVAFFLAGAPGLLLAILAVVTLKEPRREQAVTVGKAPVPSFMETLRYLFAKPSFRYLTIGATLNALVNYGHSPFIASYFLRVHPQQVAELARGVGGYFGYDLKALGFLGISLALSGSLASVFGTLAGGWISDRLAVKDASKHMVAPIVGGILTIPIFSAALLVDHIPTAMAFMALKGFVSLLWLAPVFAATQGLVSTSMRATTAAIIVLAINLGGVAVGPFLTGLMSDFYAQTMGAGDGLRWSMITMVMVDLLAVLFYWLASRTLNKDSVS